MASTYLNIFKVKSQTRIGINTSEDYGIADGLVKTDYDGMIQALPKAVSPKSSFCMRL